MRRHMKVPEKPIGKAAYLSFVECELRDSWNLILYTFKARATGYTKNYGYGYGIN